MKSNLTNVIIAIVAVLSLFGCRNAAKYAPVAGQLLKSAGESIKKWDDKHPTCQTCGGTGEVYYVDDDGNRLSDDFECPTCEGYGFVSIE